MIRAARACLLAGLLLAAGLAAHANGNNCSFQAQGLSMGFGMLDPSSGVTKTVPVAAATLSADTWGSCVGSNTMTLSAGAGLNSDGTTRRMKSANGDLIAYELVGVPQNRNAPGNNNYVTFTFNGTVAGTAYENAPLGLYTDSVIISVTP